MRIPWLLVAVAAVFVFSAPLSKSARPNGPLEPMAEPADGYAPLPGDTECSVPLADNAPSGNWSPAEQWAWDERLCLGEVADFAGPRGLQMHDCVSREDTSQRDLSEDFLQTVLFYEPFRSVWAQRGLRIACAYFPEEIDLSYGAFAHEIMIRESYFAESLIVDHLAIDGTFALLSSVITGSFSAFGLSVDGDLVLYNSRFEDRPAGWERPGTASQPGNMTPTETEDGAAGATISKDEEPPATVPEPAPAAITLRNADITGDMMAKASTVSGALDAHHLIVGGSVTLDEGIFQSVDFSDAEVAVNISAIGARIGDFLAARAHIGARLLLRRVRVRKVSLLGTRVDGDIRAGQATLCDVFDGTAMRVLGNVDLSGLTASQNVILENADIRGSLETPNVTLNAAFSAPRLSAGGDVHLGPDARFHDTLDLTRARVGGDLALAGSYFYGDVTLTDGQVDGHFRLGDVDGAVYARWPRADDPRAQDSRSDCLLLTLGLQQVRPAQGDRPEEGGGGAEAPAIEAPPGEPARDEPAPAELSREKTVPGEPFADEPVADESVAIAPLAIEPSLGGAPASQPLPTCAPTADFQPSQATLFLTDLSVGILSDHPTAWCDLRGQVRMIGFRYERLGRVAQDFGASSSQWEDWLINWLTLQHGGEGTYAHQPYQHLADTLRAQNFRHEADAIIIAANNARRKADSTPPYSSAILWVSWIMFGYGKNFVQTLFMVAALTAFGVLFAPPHVKEREPVRLEKRISSWAKLVLSSKRGAKLFRNSFFYRILYSIAMLFPERLRHYIAFNRNDFEGPKHFVHVYFLIHQILGSIIFLLFWVALYAELQLTLQ